MWKPVKSKYEHGEFVWSMTMQTLRNSIPKGLDKLIGCDSHRQLSLKTIFAFQNQPKEQDTPMDPAEIFTRWDVL